MTADCRLPGHVRVSNNGEPERCSTCAKIARSASPVGSSVPGDTEKGDDPNDERAAIVWGIVSRLTPVESDAQEACEEIEALFAPLLAEMTRQRDAWRHDALSAEDRIDALNEKLRDREAVR